MAGARAFLASHNLKTSLIKGRLAAINYFFIVRLPKGWILSRQVITVFFLSLSEYTLSMLFHMREHIISYMKWLANEGPSSHSIATDMHLIMTSSEVILSCSWKIPYDFYVNKSGIDEGSTSSWPGGPDASAALNTRFGV